MSITQTDVVVRSNERSVTALQLGRRLGVDVLAAGVASLSITPIVCLIDSTIILRAATGRSFVQCLKSFVNPIAKVPHKLLFSLPGRLVFSVYLGTYATANSIDTFDNYVKSKPPEAVTASTSKFVGTSSVSIALTVFKDSRLAQYIAGGTTKAAVPMISYGLFTARDAFTIFACFNLPILLAPSLTKLPQPVQERLGKIVQTETARLKTAQLLLPAAIQFATTPVHLLGLDFYNRQQKLAFTARIDRIVKDVGIAIPARMVRIVPAFGVGGIVNSTMRSKMMQSL